MQITFGLVILLSNRTFLFLDGNEETWRNVGDCGKGLSK